MAGKKIKDQRVVRNRRVMIYTFLLILTLLYISGHSAAEKARREVAAWDEVVAEVEDGAGGGMETGAGTEAGAGNVADAGEEPGAGIAADAREESGAGIMAGAGTVTNPGIQPEGGISMGEESGTGTEGSVGSQGETLAAGAIEEGAVAVTPEPALKEMSESSLVISPDELWCLILTNAEYPVPEDYTVSLKEVPGTEQTVDTRIYDPLMNMIEAMKAEGLSPVVCSGYRTLDKQEKLFNRKVQSYVRSGHSKQESYELARQTISIPGSGEHCLGLAVDFFTNKYHRLETGFENTPEGKWLRENAQNYGFILRYDRGKEEITGIQYEPWHFRYVGVKVAQYLKEHDLSLEEFYIEESLYG